MMYTYDKPILKITIQVHFTNQKLRQLYAHEKTVRPNM